MTNSVTKPSSFYVHTLTKQLGLDPSVVLDVAVNVKGGSFPTATVTVVLSDEQMAALFRNELAED